MYNYITDKKFISKMKGLCGDIMQDLCHQLKEEYDIGAIFYMIGSGARNLIMQNGNNPKQYHNIKNRYLCYNDYNHSSFICYIEAVNNVYNVIQWRR